MEILKIKQLEHSGLGDNAIHGKVLEHFRKSEADGRDFCKSQGYEVEITDTLLTVYQNTPYGFRMSALINKNSKPIENPPLNKNYEVGQEIILNFGWTGKVYEILTFGNKDIRPPYHRNGIPVLHGINGSLGTATIIPNDWERIYANEFHESDIMK